MPMDVHDRTRHTPFIAWNPSGIVLRMEPKTDVSPHRIQKQVLNRSNSTAGFQDVHEKIIFDFAKTFSGAEPDE